MKCQVTLVLGILFIVNCVLAQFDECGKTKAIIYARIWRGKFSHPGMWPWQVGIKIKDRLNWKTFCGGALIEPQWVLTAAHCFVVNTSSKAWMQKITKTIKKYKVVAGDHHTNSYEHSEQERIPVEIHIHPGFRYSRDGIVNDIALIKLDRNVTLGPNVRTLCLPNEDFAKPGAFGTATGWGVTESGSLSSLLRHSKHKIQDNDLCDRTTKFIFNQTVMFCAGDGKGHSDTCRGDSGGSVVRLVLVNGQHRWVTIGIVSWGEGCAVPGKYGYYTRLQPFVEWILLTKQSLCIDLGPPRNGLRTPAKINYQHNDKLRFQCNADYTMIGKSVLICQHNGTWNGYQPLCLASCRDPGVPRNAVRLGNNFKHGQNVTFICKKGYILSANGSSLIMISCLNGRWNNSTPKCIAEIKTEIIGCFRDLHVEPRPFSMRIGRFEFTDHDDFNETIFACGLAAYRMSLTVFGIQENGECWSGNNDTYSINGPSTDCHHGVGKRGSLMVYRVKKAACFPANAVLKLKTGAMATMETLRIGDEVQTLDMSTNEIFYTEVITFLHNEKSEGTLYRVIEADDGNQLFISEEHLIYSGKTKDAMNMIYAEKIQPRDYVLSGNRTSRVISVKTVYDRGLYAPMTRHGTMLVNGIYVSCYVYYNRHGKVGYYNPHGIAHWLMTPLRLWYDMSHFLRDVLASIGMKLAVNDGLTGNEMSQGIHGYIRFLEALSKYLPQNLIVTVSKFETMISI